MRQRGAHRATIVLRQRGATVRRRVSLPVAQEGLGRPRKARGPAGSVLRVPTRGSWVPPARPKRTREGLCEGLVGSPRPAHRTSRPEPARRVPRPAVRTEKPSESFRYPVLPPRAQDGGTRGSCGPCAGQGLCFLSPSCKWKCAMVRQGGRQVSVGARESGSRALPARPAVTRVLSGRGTQWDPTRIHLDREPGPRRSPK